MAQSGDFASQFPESKVQPVPIDIQVAETMVSGAHAVLMTINTCHGVMVYFMPDDMARGLAVALMERVTGLSIPVTPVPTL